MCLFISSMSVKVCIIVGPYVILNIASHLAGRITCSDREAKELNSGQEPFCPSAHTGGSKDVWGAGCEPKGRLGLSILAVDQSLRVQR